MCAASVPKTTCTPAPPAQNDWHLAAGPIWNATLKWSTTPANRCSIRELAEMMLKLAHEMPEYREGAAASRIVETSARSYYGEGYQDMVHRVPKIENTMADLDWAPRVAMPEALQRIFEFYRTEIDSARRLND